MKPILSVAVLFLSGLVLMGDEPKPDAAKAKATEKALETFAGTWEIVAVQPAGITKEARNLVFRKDGYLRGTRQGRQGTLGGNLRPRPDDDAENLGSPLERVPEERRRHLGDLRTRRRQTEGRLRQWHLEGQAVDRQATTDRVQVARSGCRTRITQSKNR